MARQKFLARLQGEISRRGTIDVLRTGIKHGPLHFDLFYGKPSAENAKAVERHAKNRFSITRQLHFSRENQRSLDLCAFVNGLPVITFELKNSLTKQTVEDAIEQYKRDRDPRETLFEFGRCVVHFAVDVHGSQGQGWHGEGFVVPALQPRLERWRRQSTEREWSQDGLPVEAHPDAGAVDGDSGELRPGRGGDSPEDGQEEAGADFPPLPSARCGADDPG
jgi:hypothetical protein